MSDRVRLDYILVCDDIRLEVGQKPSAMGIFTDGVSVPAFPHIFPKFCFLVHALLLASIEKIKVNATFQYADQPETILAKDQELKVNKPHSIPAGILLNFVVAPLVIPKAGEGTFTVILGTRRFRKKFSVVQGQAPLFVAN